MRSNASHIPFVSSAVSQKAAAMALYNINPPHACMWGVSLSERFIAQHNSVENRIYKTRYAAFGHLIPAVLLIHRLDAERYNIEVNHERFYVRVRTQYLVIDSWSSSYVSGALYPSGIP